MARSRRRRGILIGVGVLAVAAIAGGIVIATSSTRGPAPGPAETTPAAEYDRLTALRIDELRGFTDWLEANDSRGFIGEVGWPAEPPESKPWNALATEWYRVATEEGLWTTAWASGNIWDPGYKLSVYSDTDRDAVVESPFSQSEVVEEFPSTREVRTGVNVAGLEFGTEGDFSTANLGTPAETYFEESADTFDFLASRGIDTVRIPFRWERVQSEPFGELRETGVAELRRALDLSEAAGIEVILDMHNYGFYTTPEGPLQVGSAQLPSAALADAWVRLAAEFGDHPALLAYGLMNEPQGFGGESATAQAELWESVSQEVLSAVRASGDTTLIMVPGYDYSAVARFTTNHPDGWITDPADNFRYEAHQYWDSNVSGSYNEPYDEVLPPE